MMVSLIFGFVMVYAAWLMGRSHRKYRKEQEERIRMEVHWLDEELENLAQDIHDEWGSSLALMSLRLAQLEHKERVEIADLQLLRHQLQSMIDSTARVTREMKPAQLAVEGLRQTIGQYLERCRESRGMRIVYDYSMDTEPSEELAIQVYRMVLELVCNALRHANASVLEIHIKELRNCLCLYVRDNGRGMEKTLRAAQRIGMGRENVQRRVRYMNGKLIHWTVPGKGTEYFIELPLITSYDQTHQVTDRRRPPAFSGGDENPVERTKAN